MRLLPMTPALLLAACTAAGPGDLPVDDAPGDTAAALPTLLGDRFLNIAHRGGGRLAPEETMAAYQHAVDLGVDVIEIDVHSTADGVVVCAHDADVDRTTNGTGPIHGMTFDALQALDAGYRWTADGGATYPFRGTGLKVPTMEEVLRAFPGTPTAIEIKQATPDIVADVVGIVEATGAADRVVIASFYDGTIAAVREADPQLLTAFALGEMLRFADVDDSSEGLYTPPAPILQASFDDTLDAERVARAQRLGVKVHVWTVNDRAAMEAAIDMGVDGIFTDDPALLADVMAARGLGD